MFLEDQLDNPNPVILSSFKKYLFNAKVVKTNKQTKTKHNSTCFSLTLSISFTRLHVPKKHTYGWEIEIDTYNTHTLHTIVYKIDN